LNHLIAGGFLRYYLQDEPLIDASKKMLDEIIYFNGPPGVGKTHKLVSDLIDPFVLSLDVDDCCFISVKTREACDEVISNYSSSCQQGLNYPMVNVIYHTRIGVRVEDVNPELYLRGKTIYVGTPSCLSYMMMRNPHNIQIKMLIVDEVSLVSVKDFMLLFRKKSSTIRLYGDYRQPPPWKFLSDVRNTNFKHFHHNFRASQPFLVPLVNSGLIHYVTLQPHVRMRMPYHHYSELFTFFYEYEHKVNSKVGYPIVYLLNDVKAFISQRESRLDPFKVLSPYHKVCNHYKKRGENVETVRVGQFQSYENVFLDLGRTPTILVDDSLYIVATSRHRSKLILYPPDDLSNYSTWFNQFYDPLLPILTPFERRLYYLADSYFLSVVSTTRVIDDYRKRYGKYITDDVDISLSDVIKLRRNGDDVIYIQQQKLLFKQFKFDDDILHYSDLKKATRKCSRGKKFKPPDKIYELLSLLQLGSTIFNRVVRTYSWTRLYL